MATTFAKWRMTGLAGLLLLAAACGTTIDNPSDLSGALPGDERGGTSGGLPSAAPTTDGGGGTTGGDMGGTGTTGGGTTGPGGTGGTTSGGTGVVRGRGTGGTTGRVGRGPVRAAAPGITDKEILLGVGYSSQASAGNKAIGASGAAYSYDARDVWNASIQYANKNGGFAGRKLRAIFYDYNLTTDRNTQDQSACAFWTQDNKVFALLGGADLRNACAEKAGAVAIGGGSATIDTYRRFPHLVSPNGIRLDRMGKITVNGLYNAGYFKGKLGLVTWDEKNYKDTIAQAYLPTLKRYGIEPLEVAYIMVPQAIGALGDMSAAVSSAIAKFRSRGIDHVIIQDGPAGVFAGAGLTFTWMNQAKSQNYYPRYGQNASNAPGWDVMPADQMDRAIAVTHLDYDKKHDEGWKLNQAREKCYKIHADAGMPVKSENGNDQGLAGSTCDVVFFMQQVINRLTLISADTFIAELPELGESFKSAVVYGTRFVPGRRDGGSMVRIAEYFEDCRCLKYKGPPFHGD